MRKRRTIWNYLEKNFFSLLTVLVGTLILALSQLGILPSAAIAPTTLTLVILLATSQLVDTSKKLEALQDSIENGFQLNEILSKEKDLFSMIHQIAKSYLSVQGTELELFRQKAKDTLEECRDILGSLERGYMLAEPGGKYAYGTKGVLLAKQSVKAIAYEEIEVWRTLHLKSTLQANAQAVKRGVQIQRIFVVSDESLAKADDVLQEHQSAGIQVYVVSPENLPSEQLLESYLIIDDKVLVTFYLTREGKRLREERISILPTDVSNALKRFESILRRAKRYEEFNPSASAG